MYIFLAKLYIQRTASKLRQLWRHWIFLKRLTENCDRFWAREEISQHLSAFCQCERVSGRIHGVWGGVRVWRTWKDRPPVGLSQVPSQPAVVDAAEDEEADDEDGGAGEEKAGALRVERAAHQDLLPARRRTWSRKASMFGPWRAALFGHSSHTGVCFQILSSISRFGLLGSLWPSCTKTFDAIAISDDFPSQSWSSFAMKAHSWSDLNFDNFQRWTDFPLLCLVSHIATRLALRRYSHCFRWKFVSSLHLYDGMGELR